jgi:hypothetical protein
VALGQERVHRDHTTFQAQVRYEGLDGGARLRCGAAPRVALQSPRDLRRLRRCGQPPADPGGPGAQVGLARLPVHVPQDRVERGGTGGAMGQAEGVGAPRPIMASPCGDGTRAAGATHHRATRQREDGGERRALPTRLP